LETVFRLFAYSYVDQIVMFLSLKLGSEYRIDPLHRVNMGFPPHEALQVPGQARIGQEGPGEPPAERGCVDDVLQFERDDRLDSDGGTRWLRIGSP
jgi:hypothetical protein